MAKNKNKKPASPAKEEVKPHLSIEDAVSLGTEQVEPVTELPQEVAVPDEDLEPKVESTLHFSQLIGRYRESTLSPSVYKLGLTDVDEKDEFDLVVSNSPADTSVNMSPVYIIKANKKYTNKKYTLFLNSNVYNSMQAGNQLFIKPYLATLDERLIPTDLKVNSKGMAVAYDLNDETDVLALFINTCNKVPELKNKKIPYKHIREVMHDSFTAYLKDSSTPTIKEVMEEDLFD